MQQPNVILCVTDQLRPFELGCYGHPVVRTPNIDAFATEGVQFDVACSNNPICTPARSTIISGQYSRTCAGMRGCCGDPSDKRTVLPDLTIAEAYRQAGYETAHIGKWHIKPPPALLGFDHWAYPSVRHKNLDRVYFNQSTTGSEIPGWTWDYEHKLADSFFATRNAKPFFLYFNIEPPHMPLAQVPQKYLDMYLRDDVTLRPNTTINGKPAYDEHWFRVYRWDHMYMIDKQPHTYDLPQGFDLRDLTAMYYANVTLVDDLFGRLLRSLEAHGLANNTIVLFTSDHGDELGSHGCFNKIRLSEESMRVPMLIRWRAQLEPRRLSGRMMSLVDVMPTLLSLSGVETPTSVQGRDALSDEQPVDRAYVETLHPDFETVDGTPDGPGGIAVRTMSHLYGMALRGRSTYEYRPEFDEIVDDEHLFYNLMDDPYQMNNLAGTGGQRATAAAMKHDLKTWHETTPWLQNRATGHQGR